MRFVAGIRDFIPQPGGEGYEPFSQLIEKGNKWLKDQTDIRVTNMQSIMVRKHTEGDNSYSATKITCLYLGLICVCRTLFQLVHIEQYLL